MKRHSLLFTALAMTSVISYAQPHKGGVKQLSSTPLCIENTNKTTPEALYAFPRVLSYVGTITKEDNAVCNYLFPNKEINQGAYILASGNKAVTFTDTSTPQPTAWQWAAPGTAEETSNTQNLSAHYSKEGVFDFPSLTITTPDGNSTYSPEFKIKSGGISEITTIDTREYGTTYKFGAFAYNNNGGYVGGTNKVGIIGWGNLFMLGTDDTYLEGINIYLHHKPQKYAEDAQLLVQVWYPSITENEIIFRYIPIEASFVKFKDIKDAKDGVWVPTAEGAVASIKFETPVDLYGKTLLFVSVEGFGTDPSTEDFCLLTDITGKQLPSEQMANLLAHNSFGRINGETDYLRPISYYGGGTGNFAICPIIRTIVTSSIKNVSNDIRPAFSAKFSGDNIIIDSESKGQVRVFNMTGVLVASFQVSNGVNTYELSVGKGVYMLQGPEGQTAKIVK